jgi:hypothetical protein
MVPTLAPLGRLPQTRPTTECCTAGASKFCQACLAVIVLFVNPFFCDQIFLRFCHRTQIRN